MCIIFLHSDPNCSKSNYKLILAANRDEYYERPSCAANFLESNPNVLCGLDMMEGVTGGTWLGVDRFGKFAFLTNILQSSTDGNSTLVPRGTIVRNYLESDLPPEEYIRDKLVNVPFRPFNFVCGKISHGSDKIDMYYYGTEEKKIVKLQDGFHAVACTVLNGQWNKLRHGSTLFSEVVEHAQDASPRQLSEKLFTNVLSDTSCLYPDKAIQKQGGSRPNEKFLRQYCSVMIVGLESYGTVAQTVVLVDKDNRVHFAEKSLRNAAWERHEYDYIITSV